MQLLCTHGFEVVYIHVKGLVAEISCFNFFRWRHGNGFLREGFNRYSTENTLKALSMLIVGSGENDVRTWTF
ncbi:MAG: hypothetical protein IPK46_08985 [Saprospiraceae bacterium]|nr:hypothetical protein [Saprospiraceae bacterium]